MDEAIFRRANISLAMLAGTNLFLIATTFVPNPIYPSSPLLPKAALALGAINFNQLWVSGINFVKYSPEGFNTLKIFKASTVQYPSLLQVMTYVNPAQGVCNIFLQIKRMQLILQHSYAWFSCLARSITALVVLRVTCIV